MDTVLNFSYDYFELEGIPPYTSHFVPIDFRYEWWIDKTDTRKFRFEKHFVTRNAPVTSGLVVLTTSVGQKARIIHTEMWNGQPVTTEKEHPNTTATFQEWFESFTAMGRNLTREIALMTASHNHIGIETDSQWGNVHVFQKVSEAKASDLYFGMPLVVTHKIHEDDFRWIEMKQIIVSEAQEVLHRLWRMSKWVEIGLDDLPSGLFEHTR